MQNSLPLNCSRGLRCDIVENAVDAFDLACDARGDLMEHLVWDLLDGGGHCGLGIDGAEDRGPALIAAVVLYADRFDIGNDNEILQTLPARPQLSNSSRRIASASRRAWRRSRVIAPRQRTPSPGPGKG